ncbi:kinase-like domain-containing protein [Trichoderma sp. SZMC 28014]
MSSAQQKPKKRQADTSSSQTQAQPHTTKAGRSHDHVDDNELYESTQLATQSNSPVEINHDPPVAKARGSSVDPNEVEESTQLASSLQPGSYPETKIERPANEDDGQEPTQLASSLRPSPPKTRVESPAAERKPVDNLNYVEESTQLASSLESSPPAIRIESPAVETRPVDNNFVEESTQLASSLQSISSSQRKELKSRIKAARENLFKEPKKQSTGTSLRDVSPVQTPPQYPVVRKDDRSLEDVTEALEKASNLMPEARLVIRSLYSNRANGIENYSLTYPPAKDIYEHIFGVIQSKNHTDFIFETPLYRYPPVHSAILRLPPKIEFHLIYDPTSDNCLFLNCSVGWDIFLTLPGPNLQRIPIGGSHVLHPGRWMISAKAQGSNEYHPVLTALILEQRFSISVYRENVSLPSKRAVESDDGLAKRQRLNDGKSKIAVGSSDLMDEKNEESFLHNHTPRGAYNQTISPILDLTDGDVAVVEVSTAGPANTEENYQLQRIKNIVKIRATSVFTCQHSKVPGDVVAKVLRYSSDSFYSLGHISRSWKHEKRALSNLNHRNIVSLKALDGRAFAFYLEHLPASLNAVREAPLNASDAKTILRDISSALAYLSKQEIIHYDIKPANIAYSPDRGAVLMDFGLADSVATVKMPHGGTPWFVPPDALRREIRGFPGDIWALGVTMLLVLGKIALPTSQEVIHLHHLHDKNTSSHKRLKDWMNTIAKIRHKLSLENEFERLIFEMLHESGPARIEAATIELALREKKTIA